MPNTAQNVLKMFESKMSITTIKINPAPIQNVLSVIKKQDGIKTRELSSKTKISNVKLRENLNYLVENGLIEEEIIQGNIGSPRQVYSICK